MVGCDCYNNIDLYFIAMLKSGRFEQEYSVAPRKLIKLNVAESDDYNEFKGEMCEEAPPAIISGR